MSKYLFIGRYTTEGARGVLKEGGTGRRGAVLELMASLGGTVEGYYFALGSDDVYIIVDLPGPEAAAAASLAVAASGGASLRTVALLTPEELDAATKLNATYRPPYQEYRSR
jgi:uncharacterized protein with GYD domain